MRTPLSTFTARELFPADLITDPDRCVGYTHSYTRLVDLRYKYDTRLLIFLSYFLQGWCVVYRCVYVWCVRCV